MREEERTKNARKNELRNEKNVCCKRKKDINENALHIFVPT
jgi:hypothetical protein